MAKKVLVTVADGTEEIEAVCVIDVLRRAGAEVTVASVGAMTITASRGTRITADALIATCAGKSYDLIALPGGMPGSEHLRDSKTLETLLRRQFDAGLPYAAICAAPAVVLQHHGLLGKRKATSYPAYMGKLENPDTAGKAVVVDGNCITSRGAGTAMEFALALAEMLLGKAKRDEVAAAMVYES
jgi:4-methyl-5(b-hydroxyethyl)-thiazole monophosphate biosynthesis